jgi:3-phosphoshikimate 1-carboxyvinyltransferase
LGFITGDMFMLHFDSMKRLALSCKQKPINATVAIPGSKSYTNRALIMAALADGTSILRSCSPSRDCQALIDALRLLGVAIEIPDSTTLIVHGKGPNLAPYQGTIDVGPAGTTMRFLTAIAATIVGADIVLKGSDRMHERPIQPLVKTLQQAGAQIEYLGRTGCPPLRIRTREPLSGVGLNIDGTTSSQFISALLLAAPLFNDGLSVSITGKQISTSYIDMTLQGMRDFAISPECIDYREVRVAPGQMYKSQAYRIEGDASGASYLWAIAAVSGSTVTVENINPKSAQGDINFPELLAQMGCSVSYSKDSITVTGSGQLTAIEADMELMPDTAQTLSVVAAFARGDTIIRGLKTLRIKETDRISALHSELSKIGIASTPGPDYIVVHGGQPHGAQIATYEDHRMAMSFAVCASAIENMVIENPQVVEKSWPDFWDALAQISISGHGIE